MSSCCPENSWGVLLDASSGSKPLDGAMGKLLTIGPSKDLEIYVSEPEGKDAAPEKALCVFTDIYGMQRRLFAICDKLAVELQVTVVVLETFRGETAKDQSWDEIKEWLSLRPFEINAGSPNDIKPGTFPVKEDINSCFNFLSETYNIEPQNVGAAGFCWGVWAMTKACEMNLFRCGVGFHPSILIESGVFGGDEEVLVQKASDNAPLLFCVAGNDAANLKEDGALANIISSSKSKHISGDDKTAPHCIVFPEMKHGWVSRGDTTIEKVKQDAEEALNLAVDFLRQWL